MKREGNAVKGETCELLIVSRFTLNVVLKESNV